VSRVRENRMHGSTGGGLETERHSVTAPVPDPTILSWRCFEVTFPMRAQRSGARAGSASGPSRAAGWVGSWLKLLLILFVKSLTSCPEGRKPVTNQVTTHAGGCGRSRMQSD
jgi:hypothetical protein